MPKSDTVLNTESAPAPNTEHSQSLHLHATLNTHSSLTDQKAEYRTSLCCQIITGTASQYLAEFESFLHLCAPSNNRSFHSLISRRKSMVTMQSVSLLLNSGIISLPLSISPCTLAFKTVKLASLDSVSICSCSFLLSFSFFFFLFFFSSLDSVSIGSSSFLMSFPSFCF